MEGFTALESEVLFKIVERYPVEARQLWLQLVSAKVSRRDPTRCGFFTYFDVDHSTTALVGERLRDGPHAYVKGLKHPMGFILWLENGYINCLEGYSYEDDVLPDLETLNITAFEP